MSACSDFAEHVWKPGSCKNCFHPFSAHCRSTARGPAGGLPAVCLTRTGLGGGDEEPGITSPSPYSKPTIAVKPTMMMNSNDANEAMTDVNMNGGQENQKSTVERLDLKKLLDLSPLYIDGCANGLRTALLQSPGSKTDCTNYYTPLPHAPMSPMGQSTAAKHSNTSSIFVFQEAGRTLKENGSAETFRQLSSSTTTTSIATTRTTKSTYKGNGGVGLGKAASREPCGPSAGIPLSPSAGVPSSTEILPSSPAAVLNHRVNTVSPVTLTAEPSSTSPSSSSTAFTLDSFTHNAPASFHSPPPVSEPASVSDSSCSYYSSTDSLPGPERTPGGRISSPEHPQSPLTPTSPRSSPATPNGPTDAEPIYAESTKKKRRNQSNGTQAQTTAKPNNQAQRSAHSEPPSGEGQRATISVVAAHTEENNRTFFLTSPDSAVSTQCHFSPKARKDPASPAFSWPSPGHSPVDPSGHASPLPHHKPQSSPPIPPKRNIRSPKLGASSLSPSSCSPVPLPDLPALSLLSPKEGPPSGAGAADRRHKLTQHGSAWNCRIVEEEEEEEGERRDRDTKREAVKSASTSRLVGMANTAAVWREARDWRSQGNLPPAVIGTGTAPAPAQPPTSPNNGVSQGQREATGAGEEAGHTGSMLAKASLLAASTELLLGVGKKAASHESNTAPPPPPPKKHHRVCGRLSGSSMELERSASSQPGSVESLTQSLRGGLGSPTLPSASTDSLAGDAAGSRDLSRRTCSSPFARSPLASNPGSPQPDPPFSFAHNTPPPLPEKKLVNRTVSAPDSAGGKPFVRAYPRLPFTGSETNVCQSAADPGALGPTGPPGSVSRSSLPSSPLDPRGPLLFSSSESLERCHAAAPSARTSRSRTLDEPPPPLKARGLAGGGGGGRGVGGGRLGVHPRGSVTCSSSPQLSTAPPSAPEAGPAAGSCMQLQTLLSNMDSREGVYSKLGGLYAESLRRLALKCEDHFTRSQRSPLRFDESNWSLFKLTCNRPSCSSGDAVYYSAACASDTSNLYAVKICKGPSAEARQAPLYGLSVQQSVPSHFNVQQDCGHFNACVPQSMLPADEAPGPQQQQQQQADPERVVVITREVPRQSAADFAREWEAFHRAQPEAYERRVCFLLLQLCNGLEHLKESGVTHRDLCLENLLLVPHHRQPPPGEGAASDGTSPPADSQRHLPRLLISNFAKAKRRSAEDAASASADPRLKRDHARLAPEIVSAAQYRKFDEFQTGILIYELLHQANPFEVSPALKEQDYRCHDLPPIPTLSLYSAGLHRLAQLLLQPDPIKRIHIQEAKRVLQSLLWGPRRDLMEQPWERPRPGGGGGVVGDGARHEGLLNWLDVKRALLMMKFAERSLEPERNAELEDWLCCQYFSSAHPLSLCHTAELLYCLK
ncbi:inactive tyrosine-protein kinase PRAG1 [Gadus morhua]|uniref:Inactive tyrosine-protein kinase PRAG1-like n=1 Tax=Gadus morhua TaxID=8049 RepID=A0A8C5B723_GADMO|nr:inactive tyrosine-protein kinase PRAG1-like [Gadus morhua]